MRNLKDAFTKIIFLGFLFIFPMLSLVSSKANQNNFSQDRFALGDYVLPEYQNKIALALENAGENRGELIDFLTSAKLHHKKGACFLLAYMPYSDLIQAKSEVLLEHLEYAYKAKEEFIWTKNLPEDIFLNYVLPYRNSQEPIQAWRKFLFDQLYPVVKGVNSATQAAIAVNRWVAERVKYKPTQREDQGALETLKGGYGRCEELVILYNDALRSVGIPARKVWTPYWLTQDDNHAWTELWIDGEWHYTGAAEPREKLNSAWFDKVVKRTALVFSKPYGLPALGEKEYMNHRGEILINSTYVYVPTGIFKIKVISSANPVPDVLVFFSVFNYGSLRKIAQIKTDEDGEAYFSIGEGSYFISCGSSDQYTWTIAAVDADKITQVVLDISDAPKPKENFWLKYKMK